MGGYTKRVTATALVFLAYCVGNIVGPHAFLASEAPVYETGCQLILACALCQIVCAVALRVLLVKRNKRKADLDVDVGVLEDITDFEVCFSLSGVWFIADNYRIRDFDMFIRAFELVLDLMHRLSIMH